MFQNRVGDKLQRARTRGATLAIMALPLVLAVVAFILAATMTVVGGMERSSFRFYIGIISYSYLVIGFLCLPAYCVGYIWFWWKTKTENVEPRRQLLWFPLIASGSVWFPAVFFPQAAEEGRLRAYFSLAVATLVFGYAWIAIVRLVLSLRKV